MTAVDVTKELAVLNTRVKEIAEMCNVELDIPEENKKTILQDLKSIIILIDEFEKNLDNIPKENLYWVGKIMGRLEAIGSLLFRGANKRV